MLDPCGHEICSFNVSCQTYCHITRLCEQGNFTPELFQTAVADAMASGDEKQKRLDATLDKLRPRYGRFLLRFRRAPTEPSSSPAAGWIGTGPGCCQQDRQPSISKDSRNTPLRAATPPTVQFGRSADGAIPFHENRNGEKLTGEIVNLFGPAPHANQATLKKWPKNGRKSVFGHKKGSFFSPLSC